MTSALPDPFYPIVDSSDWLERLLPCGVKFVQLRIKDADSDTLRSEIKRAKALCEKYSCQLVINDYWKLAIDEACNYIHLGQEDLAGADLKAIKKAGIKLGVSTHDDAELDTALSSEPDYVALGPVYETILKKMPWAPQGLEKVADWKRRIAPLPLVAIGGLTVERAKDVLEAGADCVSVVTDILLHEYPEQRTREWITATR
jgi:thiamine-phosphate pyrophosphorylase